MGWRIHGYAVVLCIVFAVSLPFTWPAKRDSFPLSNYPMFSRPRPNAMVTIQYAVGVTADGARRHLAPEFIANDEVLQARAVLSRAVRGGSRAATELCHRIAGRVAADEALGAVIEVRIVTGTHDSVAYLTGRDRVGRERLHVRCPVPGREGDEPGPGSERTP